MYVLKENGIVVLNDGSSRACMSSADYQAASGIDLSGSDYFLYQPADGLYVDTSQPNDAMTDDMKTTMDQELQQVENYI